MANLNNDFDEVYNCQICCEQYDEVNKIPILLSHCQHSVCKVCLPGLVKNEDKNGRVKSAFSQVPTIICPFCNYEYKMNLNEFQKNLTYLEIIQSAKTANNSSLATPRYNPVMSSNYSNLNFDKPNLNKSTVPSDNNFQLVLPAAHPPPAIYRSLTEAYMKNPTEWNQNKYLRKLFNNVDLNNEGSINIDQLHDALVRGQPNLKFDKRTVQLLVNKYNYMNSHAEIDFEVFKHLFHFLNEEYERFVAADFDASGTIDSGELSYYVKKRGYDQFDRNFCDFIIETIMYNTGNRVSFDYFCRIMARLDYLTQSYDFELSNNEMYNRSYPLRAYVQNNFFSEFW